MTEDDTVKRHTLPPDKSGQTRWFDQQNDFEQAAVRRQVAFRRKYWPQLKDGPHSKAPDHTYPHILPLDTEIENSRRVYYEPIADEIRLYLAKEKIAQHTETLNLKSSQTACFNFLFPLRQNLDLATSVFRQLFGRPELKKATGLEFEYTSNEIAAWLGEPKRGKRGQNRTSIDAAVFWDDESGKPHATLIEWKYTERSFGACSAFSSTKADGRSRCLTLNILKQPNHACMLTDGGDNRSRKYWEHLIAAGIMPDKLAPVIGCPFQGPFFQLMRQFLVAAYLRENGIQAEVTAISFAGNASLQRVPPQIQVLSPFDIVGAWNAVLGGVPPLQHYTAEQLVACLDTMPSHDLKWREYLKERYGV